MASETERAAASLFSPSLFRSIISQDGSDRTRLQLGYIRDAINLSDRYNIDLVNQAYDLLFRYYRTEYVYKNLITRKIFVGRHRAANSALFQELQIGSSWADCVLINGSGTVYEIKSEFDSPDKLPTQLTNYYKAFPNVYCVVNESHTELYVERFQATPVGVLSVKRSGALSVAKTAEYFENAYDITTMYNMLRFHEVKDILNRIHGSAPEVPTGLRYTKYLERLHSLPVLTVQKEMQSTLKDRSSKEYRKPLLDKKLTALSSIVAKLNINHSEYQSLLRWLDAEAI